MGNSFTCVWTVAYFTLVEYLMLENRFKIRIKLMVRLTSDILIFWEKEEKKLDDWSDLKLFLNQA